MLVPDEGSGRDVDSPDFKALTAKRELNAAIKAPEAAL